jgi:large subunit ribosomal protein L15
MPGIERIKHPSNKRRGKRVGRGMGSGKGQKAGRGQTGQKSRSGGSKAAQFEGGRMPMVRQFAKIGGFKHHSKIVYHVINLRDFDDAIDGAVVDLMYLEQRGLLPKKLRGLRVKLLGDGALSAKLTFKLHAFSNSARKLVEDAGGVCEVIQ